MLSTELVICFTSIHQISAKCSGDILLGRWKCWTNITCFRILYEVSFVQKATLRLNQVMYNDPLVHILPLNKIQLDLADLEQKVTNYLDLCSNWFCSEYTKCTRVFKNIWRIYCSRYLQFGIIKKSINLSLKTFKANHDSFFNKLDIAITQNEHVWWVFHIWALCPPWMMLSKHTCLFINTFAGISTRHYITPDVAFIEITESE